MNKSNLWRPAAALWHRDVVRFLRQRNRIIGALATPLVFWVLLGAGFTPSFRPDGGDPVSYLAYFFPGTLVLIMLFTAIFSTISVIEDRREGFLQGVLVAPVSPAAIVLGKFLGGTTLAVGQAILFCVLAPFAGIRFPIELLPSLALAFVLVAFSMTGLGFLVAWPMDSTQGFHAIMNIVLMPLWMVSGALFPIPPGNSVIGWLGAINPVTYGVAAIRQAMGGPEIPGVPNLGLSLAVTALFCVVTFLASLAIVLKRRKTA
ncbi:MAG: ABC transporter permease [Terrimicrobiaceae bacterium]|nr:ABC transporter permease [Terrimicrobiaceae bacterium]